MTNAILSVLAALALATSAPAQAERPNPFRAAYREFVAKKVALDASHGFPCEAEEVSPLLFPFQRACVAWAVQGGRRGLFLKFGLGKTRIQLETIRLTCRKSNAFVGLIVVPLNVRQEFIQEAATLGIRTAFVQTDADADAAVCADRTHSDWGETSNPLILLTNYESVREGKLDPTRWGPISLDEASILRGLGGTKTFREFMGRFEGTNHLRFVATATPSPNDYIELLAYAAYLGVMDVGQAKTRFFKRNSEKADDLTIFPGREREFWLWVSSWGLFVNAPSDLGFSDEGYVLPDLDVRWHMVETDHTTAEAGAYGQGKLLKDVALGLSQAAREKRESLPARVAKMMELRGEDPDAHRILWHDLEAERAAIEAAVPDVLSVYGAQSMEEREAAVYAFSHGHARELAGKPVMLGSGCNLQRHCSWAIYLGIGFKFNDLIQSIHRLQRFGQRHTVRIDLIYTEAEVEVRRALEAKWERHREQVAIMAGIVREYGLGSAAIAGEYRRALGIVRQVAEGKSYRLALNDCVLEMMGMEDGSVHFVFTSIPFEGMYEYSPNYNDFGHTDDSDHFWEQMRFVIRELLRVVKPGRVVGIHVKDRVVDCGLSGMGFQTVNPVSDRCVREFTEGGFGFLGRVTVVTDVVRENNQTYRLGWREQCKDGSRMGFGLPEYVLYFRKPPTDRSNGYADDPVVKGKRFYNRETKEWDDPDGYSVAAWQVDAHGFHRSSGNRFLTAEDLRGLDHKRLFRLFRDHSRASVYDFAGHVAAAEFLVERGMLPSTFMLLQPASWHPDVWTDVARMRTLNTMQGQRNREKHLCPLQFDIVDRAIKRFSMPGEIVYDPFAGLGTVPLRAAKFGRIGWGSELAEPYWRESAIYAREAEAEASIPTLFDAIGEDSSDWAYEGEDLAGDAQAEAVAA